MRERLTGFEGPELGGRSDLLGGREQADRQYLAAWSGIEPCKDFSLGASRMLDQAICFSSQKTYSQEPVLRFAVAPYCLRQTTAPKR